MLGEVWRRAVARANGVPTNRVRLGAGFLELGERAVPAVVSGVVSDDEGPLGDVAVCLTKTDENGETVSYGGRTNADGEYSFGGVADGLYTLLASRDFVDADHESADGELGPVAVDNAAPSGEGQGGELGVYTEHGSGMDAVLYAVRASLAVEADPAPVDVGTGGTGGGGTGDGGVGEQGGSSGPGGAGETASPGGDTPSVPDGVGGPDGEESPSEGDQTDNGGTEPDAQFPSESGDTSVEQPDGSPDPSDDSLGDGGDDLGGLRDDEPATGDEGGPSDPANAGGEAPSDNFVKVTAPSDPPQTAADVRARIQDLPLKDGLTQLLEFLNSAPPEKATLLKDVPFLRADDLPKLPAGKTEVMMVGDKWWSGTIPPDVAVGPNGCGPCVGLILKPRQPGTGPTYTFHFSFGADVKAGLVRSGALVHEVVDVNGFPALVTKPGLKGYEAVLCGAEQPGGSQATDQWKTDNASRLQTLEDVVDGLKIGGIGIRGYVTGSGVAVDAQGNLYYTMAAGTPAAGYEK